MVDINCKVIQTEPERFLVKFLDKEDLYNFRIWLKNNLKNRYSFTCPTGLAFNLQVSDVDSNTVKSTWIKETKPSKSRSKQKDESIYEVDE